MILVFVILFASATAYKPVPRPKCGLNEVAVPCKTICPPQSCNISYTDYACDPKPKCIPGCDCIENHLRNNDGDCILNEKCPPYEQCGENEVAVPCKTQCPPQNCDISYTSYLCDPNPNPKCVPGCDCIEGCLRNDEGKCVPTDQCPIPNQVTETPSDTITPPPPDKESPGTEESSANVSSSSSSSSASASSSSSSSTYSSTTGGTDGDTDQGQEEDCTSDRCTPTCSQEYPTDCPAKSNPCNCPPGSVVSDIGGKCVPREECPKYVNCKGDYNATITNCPIACPSTCAKPDAEYCNTQCGTPGCACKPGYILIEENGTCIKPEDCPGGNACGNNETFVNCLIKCPNSYCPVDDSRAFLICDPPYPCPSGCGCKRNFYRKSVDDDVCVHGSDCPPVKCTRPNEEWNPCTGPCFSDYCSDRNKVQAPGDCGSFGPECKPQCVCKQGFYRNGTDICVTAQECSSDKSVN